MANIYHIALVQDWDEALTAGRYEISTRGRTLQQEGFIHASDARQVAPVANAFYTDAGDLVLLELDPGRLVSEVVYEYVPGSDEPFPHIYGPINTDAVVAVRPLERDAGGRFVFVEP